MQRVSDLFKTIRARIFGTAARVYADFDLLIQREQQGYRVQVLDSPAGSAGPEVVFQLPERDLERTVKDPVREFGGHLFETFFRGSILVCFRESRSRITAEKKGLRVKLRLGEVPELVPLPWEYLYDKERDDLLALSRQTPVVRYLHVAQGRKPLRVKPPLRVLALISSPPELARLDVEKEWNELSRALSSLVHQGRVVLKRLPRPTLSALADALREKEWHVLHYIGHGVFSEENEGGALVFEDEQGNPVRVGHNQLGVLFDEPSLRLVVLNACEGARASPADAFTGVAQTLVRRGIPAVVAMQSEVSDEMAIELSRCFYRHLAELAPVDLALTEARRQIHNRCPETAAWSAPVLYMHTPDGRLFDAPIAMAWKIAGATALVTVLAGLPLLWRHSTGHDPPRPALPPNPSECPSPIGLDMAFVKVEPGALQTDGERSGELAPTIQIDRPFCLGRYEVTREQWARIMEDATGPIPQAWLPKGSISWAAAQDFIAKLNEREGRSVYRLPTEIEWEYAARAGTTTDYSFGDDPTALSRFANCLSEKGDDGYDGPAPVGSFQPNHLGLYDMYGNVWEWVSGNAGEDSKGVRRGGSWSSSSDSCRSAHRSTYPKRRRHKENGFRLVREPAIASVE